MKDGTARVSVKRMRLWQWALLYARYRRGEVARGARLPAEPRGTGRAVASLGGLRLVARVMDFCQREQFGVFLEGRKGPVGTVTLKPTAKSGRDEVGYWIGRPFWGQGLATAAVQAVVTEAFRRPETEEVVARTAVRNVASQRVLEKCGFANEPAAGERGGAPTAGPIVLFRLSRAEWRRRTGEGAADGAYARVP